MAGPVAMAEAETVQRVLKRAAMRAGRQASLDIASTRVCGWLGLSVDLALEMDMLPWGDEVSNMFPG